MSIFDRHPQRKRQVNASCDDRGLSRIRLRQYGVSGGTTPVLAKHTKHFSLIDAMSVGVDRMQRNFDPMRQQIALWKENLMPDDQAKLVIYQAFVEDALEAPKHLAQRVHELYFNSQFGEFAPRTRWSLANSFTSAFKELDPIPQFRATAKLGPFLEAQHDRV